MNKPFYPQLNTAETIEVKQTLKKLNYKSKIGIINDKYVAKAYDSFGNEMLIVKRNTIKGVIISLTPSLYKNWNSWEDIMLTNKNGNLCPNKRIVACSVLINNILK